MISKAKFSKRQTLKAPIVSALLLGAAFTLLAPDASGQHGRPGRPDRPAYPGRPGQPDRPGYPGRPGRPDRPGQACQMRGGRRSADLDRVVNHNGGVEIIHVRQVLRLGHECRGIRLEELRLYAGVLRDHMGRRGGAEATLLIDGRRSGPAQRLSMNSSSPVVFRFPANDNQLDRETRTIALEIRGRALSDTVELVADRWHGGFDDDERTDDEYSHRPIRGYRESLGTTFSAGLFPTRSTIYPSRRQMMLKGLELRALDDDFQILSVKVYFADRGIDTLELGRRFLSEDSSVYIDFEGGRFRDVRAVSRIEIVGKQVDPRDRRPRLRVIGIESGRGGGPRPPRGRP